MPQAVSRRSVTKKSQVRSFFITYEICGEWIFTGAAFSLRPSFLSLSLMSISLRHYCISIHTLLLSEWQTGETKKPPKKAYLWVLLLGICVSRLWPYHSDGRSTIYDLAVRDSSVSVCLSKALFLNRRAATRYRALASIIPGRETFSWNMSY